MAYSLDCHKQLVYMVRGKLEDLETNPGCACTYLMLKSVMLAARLFELTIMYTSGFIIYENTTSINRQTERWTDRQTDRQTDR